MVKLVKKIFKNLLKYILYMRRVIYELYKMKINSFKFMLLVFFFFVVYDVSCFIIYLIL